MVNRGRVAFDGSLQRIIDDLIAGSLVIALFGFIGHYIQQEHLHTDAGKMAGDSRAHHSAS